MPKWHSIFIDHAGRSRPRAGLNLDSRLVGKISDRYRIAIKLVPKPHNSVKKLFSIYIIFFTPFIVTPDPIILKIHNKQNIF
jgi:hypothetical protein